jgi:hypothetical protein
MTWPSQSWQLSISTGLSGLPDQLGNSSVRWIFPVCSVCIRVQPAAMNGHPNCKQGVSRSGRGMTIHTYERPTLFVAGSFEKLTGLAAFAPRETLVQPQLL